MATYAELQQQIKALQAEAERIKNEEIDGVIARIKEAIEHYNLSPADLGFGKAKPAAPKAAGKRRKPGRPAGKPGAKPAAQAREVKYRDSAGNTWGGRGPRPQWLRTALNSGKSLQDFQV